MALRTVSVFFVLGTLGNLTLGCSSPADPPPGGAGSVNTGTGGSASGFGGTTSSGGSTSGGAPSNGGTTTSGGAPSNGGTTTSGGAATNGGSTSGATSGGATSGGATTAGTTNGGATTGGAATGGKGNAGATSGGTTSGGASSGGATATGGGSSTGLAKFSFFVTSLAAMRELSKSQDGFGGDLRYGEATGLAGADKICTQIAEKSMAGSGVKQWRAFLSTVNPVVNAKDRIGQGPWYDRLGRVVSMNLTNLLNARPTDADPAIKFDLPNENGVPNHTDGAPGCSGNACPDNHDTLTGTGPAGLLYKSDLNSTCNDWTSKERSGKPWCGHSWPRDTSATSKENWMSTLAEAGCAPSVGIVEMGPPMASNPTVGSGGGYGGIYCFALSP